jgi:hypothetical protein
MNSSDLPTTEFLQGTLHLRVYMNELKAFYYIFKPLDPAAVFRKYLHKLNYSLDYFKCQSDAPTVPIGCPNCQKLITTYNSRKQCFGSELVLIRILHTSIRLRIRALLSHLKCKTYQFFFPFFIK